MIRQAGPGDCQRVIAIRDAPGEHPLCDPSALADADATRFIAAGTLLLWEDAAGVVTGFIALDLQNGAVTALLVAAGHDGKGVGRALLAAGCDALRQAGHAAATLALASSHPAERHYRAAGWVVGKTETGEVVLQKTL